MTDQQEPPRYFGYCRISTDEQNVSSLDTQEDMAREECKRFGGVFVRAEKETASARYIPWDERRGLVRLLNEMRRGDHLVISSLDRLDRTKRLMEAMEHLHKAGVVVHPLDTCMGERFPPLDTLIGKIVLMVMMLVSEIFLDQNRTRTKNALHWRKKNGYAYTGPPGYGKRREVLPLEPGQHKPLKRDVWDEEQCSICWEIVRRHDLGETWQSIARDFHLRGLKLADGKPWTHVHEWFRQDYGPNYSGGYQKAYHQRKIRAAYRMFKRLLLEAEAGEHLMVNLPFIPEPDGSPMDLFSCPPLVVPYSLAENDERIRDAERQVEEVRRRWRREKEKAKKEEA